MIRQHEIFGLRHSEYNSDPVVMEMLDTLEALWRVARAATAFRNGKPDGDVDLSAALDALSEKEEP